jgi:two-component system, NarL family, sensor histidine kinase UhpB
MLIRWLTVLSLLCAHVCFVPSAGAQTPAIDSLQRIIARGQQDSTEAITCIRLADEFSRTNLAEARKCCFSAISLSRRLNLPTILSAAYADLVVMNGQTNQPDSARHYLSLLQQLAGGSTVKRVKENYYSTAGLFYRRTGNYKAALPYLQECLRLLMAEDNKTGMAGQSLNIGNNYLDMGQYKKAMTWHLKALKIFETLGNKRGISFCYNAIGNDFVELKQFADGLRYLQRSQALKTELNDTRGLAFGYNILGQAQEGLGDYEKALLDYRQALAINRELKLVTEEAKTDLNIGKLFERINQADSAKEYFQQSKTLIRQIDDTALLASVNQEMEALQNNLIRIRSTEKTFLSTLSTSIEMGDKKVEVSNYKFLADFYAKNKQYDKALGYNERYHSQMDSMQGKELQLQMKALEQQYSMEKKEKEITLLKEEKLLYQANLRNQEIFRYASLVFLLLLIIIGFLVVVRYRVVQKTMRLVEIEKIRNNIARNLHDDIGSTLTSINILSKVALQQAAGDERIVRDLEKIKDRSATIMECMGDIVWAINPANDPLDRTILKMKEFAAEILEEAGIGFTFQEDDKLADCTLGVTERKNIYLIFKESIHNMVKYSGATEADITLQKTANRFSLKISDNGKGFDTTRQHAGNGLKNMQGRASEMNAVLVVDSSPATGTCVYVAVPIT